VAFLEARPPEVLDRVLVRIAADLPRGSIFGGMETDLRGIHALLVRHPDGSQTALPLGSATQIGPVLRLWGGPAPDGLQVGP
jgi:hypothetical protein